MTYDKYKDSDARREYLRQWRKSSAGKESLKKVRDKPENVEKRRISMKKWRAKNYESERKKRKERYDETSRKIEEYKAAHPCKCGTSNPICLTFHHRDPKTKKFGIGSWRKNSWSWGSVLAEIEKCDVICANCHLLIHNS